MVGPPSDPTSTIKFLCSYGGKILPRHRDGKLRYVGGHTRVLAVHRSISFSELLLKLEDLCGATVRLRCQLPTEDLDTLVSIKSDEDLANLIEEYDRADLKRPSLKIRAFLSAPSSSNQQRTSPASSDTSSPKSLSPRSWSSSGSFSSTSAVGSSSESRFPVPLDIKLIDRCLHQAPAPSPSPVTSFPLRSPRHVVRYAYDHYGKPSNIYLVHNGNHWQ